jgi:PAS domain S-box-containing protein
VTDQPDLDEQTARYRFALEGAGIGVWEWSVGSGAVWWSDNLFTVHGISAERFDGTFAGFLNLLHPDDRGHVGRAIDDALAQGGDYEVEFRVVGDDGRVRWISGKGCVFCDETGAPLRMVGTGADVTARRRAAERERLLADAGELLALSLDISATLEQVARLAVPRLADWCVVDLLENDGLLHRLHVVHRDPARAPTAEELKRRYPRLTPEERHTIWEVVRTGQSRLDPAVTEERFVREVRDPQHLALLRELGFAAELVAPLIARGRSLGALTFVHAHSHPGHVPDDVALAEELARRCALALDNARLYQAARTAEAAARASEARYRAIVETTNEGVWLVDRTGRTLYANDRMAQLLGTTTAALSAGGMTDFLFPDDTAGARRQIARTLRGRVEQFDVRFRRTDGAELLALACTSPMRDEDDEVVGVLGMFTDVTERRRGEESFRFLAAASGDLAASLDLRATLANIARSVVPRLADWCVLDLRGEQGFERVAVVHREPEMTEEAERLRREYPPDLRSPGGVGLVLRTGAPAFSPVVTDELASAAARNDPALLALLRALGLESFVVVPLAAGEEILGALSLIHGRSGRRHSAHDLAVAGELARRAAVALENARLHAKAQAAIEQRDEFLAFAAHDLKSPLTVIQGRAQNMRRRLKRTGEADLDRLEVGLAEIQATATRMARLIDELQDLATLKAGQRPELLRRPVDLVALATDEVALLESSSGLPRIRLVSTETDLVAEVDEARFARVLANLLGNALKFSPEGEEVVLELGRDADGWALVAVRDQGVGIPAEELPRIFDRYYRGSNVAGRVTGSGIGLAGVRQIVEQHGGTISATSQVGRGSSFTLRLPPVPQSPASLVDAGVVEPLHPSGGPIETEVPSQREAAGQPNPNS